MMWLETVTDALGMNNLGSEQISNGKPNDAMRSYQHALALLRRATVDVVHSGCGTSSNNKSYDPSMTNNKGEKDNKQISNNNNNNNNANIRFSLSTGDDDGCHKVIPNLQQKDGGSYIFDRAIHFDCDPNGELIDSNNLVLIVATVAFNMAVACHAKARAYNGGRYIARAKNMYASCMTLLLQNQHKRQRRSLLPSYPCMMISMLCKNNMAQLMYVDCCDYTNGIDMMNEVSELLSCICCEQQKTQKSIKLLSPYDVDHSGDERGFCCCSCCCCCCCDLILESDIDAIFLNGMQLRHPPTGAMAA